MIRLVRVLLLFWLGAIISAIGIYGIYEIFALAGTPVPNIENRAYKVQSDLLLLFIVLSLLGLAVLLLGAIGWINYRRRQVPQPLMPKRRAEL